MGASGGQWMDADDSLERLAGEDQGETAVHAAHMQYTAACCALRAAIALCLEAFVEGHVTAATLGRACRTSLADPKKVISSNSIPTLFMHACYSCLSLTNSLTYRNDTHILTCIRLCHLPSSSSPSPSQVIHRYQRAYVMWSVHAAQTTRSLLTISSLQETSGQGLGLASPGSGSVTQSAPATVTYFAADQYNQWNGTSALALEARHSLVTSSLRHLLVTTNLAVRLTTGRETRPKGECWL